MTRTNNVWRRHFLFPTQVREMRRGQTVSSSSGPGSVGPESRPLAPRLARPSSSNSSGQHVPPLHFSPPFSPREPFSSFYVILCSSFSFFFLLKDGRPSSVPAVSAPFRTSSAYFPLLLCFKIQRVPSNRVTLSLHFRWTFLKS